MGRKPIDPRQQFSKKLAMSTAVFWFFYMTWLSVLMMLQPSVAEYSFYMAVVASIVMMINVISYSANSIIEKKLLGILDRTKIELQFGPAKVSVGDNSDTDLDGEVEDDG